MIVTAHAHPTRVLGILRIHSTLLLSAITFFAALLRFYKLGSWSFWVEEYHMIAGTQSMNSVLSVITSIRPVFPLILKPVFYFLGVNEWTARFVPVLAGVASIPLLFWVTKKMFRQRVAFLAAVLLAISPWHLYWSQNARFYTLFLALFALSLFTFYMGIEKDRFRYILISAAMLALATATHGLGALLVPLFIAYYLLLKVLPFEKPSGLRFRNLAPFLLLPLIGYLSFEILLALFTDRPPFYTEFFNEFSKSSVSSWIGYSSPYVMLTSVVYYIGAPLAFLALTGSAFLLKRKSRSGLMLTVSAFGPLLTMMFFTIFASTANRYAFMTLPYWVILGAVGVWELYHLAKNQRAIWPWVLAILLLFTRDPVIEDLVHYLKIQPDFRLFFLLLFLAGLGLVFLYARLTIPSERKSLGMWGIGILLILLLHPVVADRLYFEYQHGHRDDWRAAASTIQRERAEGDIVVSSIPPLAAYYLGQEVADATNMDFETILKDGRRVWIIQDFGLDQITEFRFEEWAKDHCVLVGSWDQYTAGRNWTMRDYLCSQQMQASQ